MAGIGRNWAYSAAVELAVVVVVGVAAAVVRTLWREVFCSCSGERLEFWPAVVGLFVAAAAAVVEADLHLLVAAAVVVSGNFE